MGGIFSLRGELPKLVLIGFAGFMGISLSALAQDAEPVQQAGIVKTVPEPAMTSKYFVIQNVATETTRVYERCQQKTNCQHKLIYESDMVVGRRKNLSFDPKEWYTNLGVTKIRSWEKFHQDSHGHYPAWYSKNYPPVPPPGSSFYDWFERDVMPDDIGVMRGAFGWFTAILGPNANSQWMHGTAGWGADGPKYIDITRNVLISSVRDARSSGCTRIENGGIAYLRHILPVGTPIIRVYAKEAVEDAKLSRYQDNKAPEPFYYILTRTNRINDPTADTIERNAVLARGVPQNDWIEEGEYNVDRFPSVRPYRITPIWIGAGSGALGNVYRVMFTDFEGHYLIDTGRFVGYQHPSSLPVAGIPNLIVPEYTMAPKNVEPLDPESEQD